MDCETPKSAMQIDEKMKVTFAQVPKNVFIVPKVHHSHALQALRLISQYTQYILIYFY